MSAWTANRVEGQIRHHRRCAQPQAVIGFWDMDASRDCLTGDACFARLMGLETEAVAQGISLEKALSNLSSYDQILAGRVFSKSDFLASEPDVPYRVRRPDGGMRWVTLSGRLVNDGEGGQARMSGVVVDQTHHSEALYGLPTNELRFRALAETLPQNVFSADATGVHDFLNRRWYEYTGADLGPVNADKWVEYVHPDDVQATIEKWRECLELGTPYDIEYRYRRHDGQYRWMRAMAMPEQNDDGSVCRWFGTATDIHETKLLAEEREVISAELGHRIKNLFSVFGGLISLSPRANDSVVEFAEALQKRLSALAVAHDFLNGSPEDEGAVQGHSLHLLLSTLAEPYWDATLARFSCAGDNLGLSKTAITPIALIAHELLTNAVKYGALSEPEGAIAVETRIDGPWLYLTWSEIWPDAHELQGAGKGFGTSMLSTVVERLLQGRLERQIRDTGFTVNLILPLDRLTANAA